MAYTLTDPFRTLRSVVRFDGTTLSLVGLALLLAPKSTMIGLGITAATPAWPVRLAGAALSTLALYFLLAATERSITTTALITVTVGNSLIAVVLLIAYVQGQFPNLSIVGLLLLIGLFIVCLIGAVTPLRYLRAEYREV